MRGTAARWGYDWDALDHRAQVDLAEQALFEPAIASGLAVDTILDRFTDTLNEMFPTEDTWGTGPSAAAAQAAAESKIAPANPRDTEVPVEASTLSGDAEPS